MRVFVLYGVQTGCNSMCVHVVFVRGRLLPAWLGRSEQPPNPGQKMFNLMPVNIIYVTSNPFAKRIELHFSARKDISDSNLY